MVLHDILVNELLLFLEDEVNDKVGLSGTSLHCLTLQKLMKKMVNS